MSKRHMNTVTSMLSRGLGVWLYPDGRLTNGRCWVKLPGRWAEKLKGDERVRFEDDVAKLPNLDEVLDSLTQGQSEWVDLTLVGEDPYSHRPVVGCHFDGRTCWFTELAIDCIRACGATIFHLYLDTGYVEGRSWAGRVVGGVMTGLAVPDEEAHK